MGILFPRDYPDGQDLAGEQLVWQCNWPGQTAEWEQPGVTVKEMESGIGATTQADDSQQLSREKKTY